jgi:enoyl-CoA hydratase/carnithine racemase
MVTRMEADALAQIEALNPQWDSENSLLLLDLNHGKANEMGSEQLSAFETLCEILESDDSVRCLCTSSRRVSKRGTPIFISGANVTERGDWDDAKVKAHVHRQRALMRRLRRLPLFTIALTHGVTLGWGVEFLLTADYTLATAKASLGLPETGLGIIPGARGSAELRQVVGLPHAMRLGMTGERIDATEALRIGLVQEVHDDVDQALERVKVMASNLSKKSPTSIAAFKRATLNGIGLPEDERLAAEAQAYELCVDSGEAAIGRASFDTIRAGQAPAWGARRRD